ncbi:TonB-dependent receptor [Ideonella margarita]|uniref:TonB-dependent receptor n=1 Tax=Ideonella margarita TaxID=2984191 RepID=A0ABU9C4F5_9BURK
MANNTTTSIWRHSAIAVAVGLCVASSAGYAQSNATGNIFGTVQAVAGTTVVVENTATGAKRTLTPDASGRFTATSLPTGTYKVTVLRNGAVVSTADNIDVLIGQGSEAIFAAAAVGGTQTVQVVGKVAKIDVSSSNNGSTFTSKQLAALPIARNVDAIIQLAPNTTRADPRYSGGASIGGGAPSENSYYINGFPVTNPLNQLGSSELPFGAVGQAQVLTGGFGAEFGRSIGGVVNITTKSGTNEWEAGFNFSLTPNALRAKSRDIYYPVTGAPGNEDTDGKLFRRRTGNSADSTSIGAYVGGPLIKDQLFMFVAAEKLNTTSGTLVNSVEGLNTATAGWSDKDDTTTRYLGKFDWNITSDNRLELTLIGDRYAQTDKLSGYSYANDARNGVVTSTGLFTNQPDHNNGVGASSQILKYTSYLTDDLTLTALVGKSKTPHINNYAGVDVNSQIRQVSASGTAVYPGFTYKNVYPIPFGTRVLGAGAEDTVKAQRLDLEYRLGDHSIRGGIDRVKLASTNAGEYYAGNGVYVYASTTSAGLIPTGMKTSVGAAGALVSGGRYYYGREQIFNTVTNAYSDQSAQYIEDKWQITKNLAVTAGLRNEQYANKNGDGETFLEMKNQINPRLAFSWDVAGDSSTKVYGSAGRYAVQIPTHLAVRGASRSTFTRQFFVYTGVDANGAPIGRVNLGDPYSSNNEYGQAKDANTVSAKDMKPSSQDEISLGLDKALSDELVVGARLTYRRLNSTIDDLCDPRAFDQYAVDNKIDTTNWGGFGCASFNPGVANDFLIDYSGKGNYTKVHLTKEQLGFDKAKRTYAALDLYAEHPLKNGWYGKVTYTYAKNKGNTEGQTLSDVAQTDVAATQTWDHPELMQGAYGYLPGDRRHQIKAFGTYDITPEFTVGANLLLASGRPRNCIGNYPDGQSQSFDDYQLSYGSAYRYCTVNGVTSPSPRGTAGNLPWDRRLDASLTYKPDTIKGLALRVEVFNVFNSQIAQAVEEVHETDGDSSSILPTYGRVLSYTPARSVKLSVSYDKKF